MTLPPFQLKIRLAREQKRAVDDRVKELGTTVQGYLLSLIEQDLGKAMSVADLKDVLQELVFLGYANQGLIAHTAELAKTAVEFGPHATLPAPPQALLKDAWVGIREEAEGLAAEAIRRAWKV